MIQDFDLSYNEGISKKKKKETLKNILMKKVWIESKNWMFLVGGKQHNFAIMCFLKWLEMC